MRLATPGGDGHLKSAISGFGTAVARAATRPNTVRVNCHTIFGAALPFGGYQRSGWGREMGHEVVNLYTRIKSLWIRLSSHPSVPPAGDRSAPSPVPVLVRPLQRRRSP